MDLAEVGFKLWSIIQNSTLIAEHVVSPNLDPFAPDQQVLRQAARVLLAYGRADRYRKERRPV
jgi:hypothetical protein